MSLSSNGKRAFLKKLDAAWDSPTVTDVFLDDSLRQRYVIRRNPAFDPDMPDRVPDRKARRPAAWDDDEDGPWAAPLVPNTHRLKQNRRYIVSAEH